MAVETMAVQIIATLSNSTFSVAVCQGPKCATSNHLRIEAVCAVLFKCDCCLCCSPYSAGASLQSRNLKAPKKEIDQDATLCAGRVALNVGINEGQPSFDNSDVCAVLGALCAPFIANCHLL